jgi:cbb3-type cytochrome oxidase subunit 3
MKAKNINIILIFILILICIILLYILFNNKHHEIYNEMNKLILKEKFNVDVNNDCMNSDKQNICENISLTCKSSNADEGCENEEKYQGYCNYLSSIQNVLKSSCFSCDEKQNIIDTAKRVNCLSLAGAIDEGTT